MCFRKKNENFIRIELFSKMKGLNDSEKLEKYLELKDDVFKRLKNSYINCNNRIDFYKDAFEVLGFYEGEYLILNLFLEDNCVKIINLLLSDGFFKKVSINVPNANSISYYFYDFIILKSDFTNSDLVSFLKINSIELTQTINQTDWTNENRQSNPLINKFSAFFVKVEMNNSDMRIYGYYLFTKIWNHFDLFLNPFNNTKGIILFYDLNKYLEKNECSNFYTFYEKLNEVSNLLLVEINYLPIIDKKNNASYKDGYLKNRRIFGDFMELQKQRINVSNEMNYSKLITLMSKSDDNLLIDKCKQTILIKTNNFEYPDSNEMNTINNMTENNKNINAFFQKFYIY